MRTDVLIGDTIRIQVTFRDWSSVGNGDIIDPDIVTVDILDEDFVRTPEIEEAVKVEDGVYYYDWTPLNAGVFYIEFIGTFNDGQTSVVRERFEVSKVASGPSPSGVSLGEDQEFVFATILTPLYVDPEELLHFYPESNNVEVMELISRYSREVAKILGLDMSDPEPDVPFLALEYIRAAVLCALSRIHDYTFGGDASSLSLGDLKISNQSYPRDRINRANAASWCELAAILREELMRGEAGIKAVVKGTNYTNPMPKRKLKSYYGGNGRRSF